MRDDPLCIFVRCRRTLMDMKWIISCTLLILATVLVSAPTTALAGGSPPKIVVRVHVENVAKELKGRQTFMVQLPDPPEALSVVATPEASERDVINVVGKPTSNGYGAYIYFNRKAAVNLSATTAQNAGRVLVVVINNRVVYAPVID